jgi:oligosaccharide repeat unit polymerase
MFKFIFVSFVLFVALLQHYKRKGSILYPSVFVLFLYTLSVLLSYPHIMINDEKLSLDSKYFLASIVFLLLLFLFLSPFVSFREDTIKKIQLPSPPLLKTFSVLIVLLSLYSIAYFIPVVIYVFSIGNFYVAREGMIADGPYVNVSIYNTIASVSASFYSIAIFLFFIYRAKGTNKLLSIFLLISSFSYVLNVFAYSGRDGVVFWLFSFLVSYGFFRDFLPQKDQSLIKRILFLFLILIIPIFISITSDRFSDNVFGGILSYLGQQFPNFCLSFQSDYPVSNGATFPLFRKILGLPEVVGYSGEFGGTYTWVFGTFLKSLILNFDIIMTIIIGVFMGLFFRIAFIRSNKNIAFYQLFLYFLYFNIFSQGVFYFRQYGMGGNLFIVLSVLFYFVFMVLMKLMKIKSGTSEYIYRK